MTGILYLGALRAGEEMAAPWARRTAAQGYRRMY